MKMLKGMKSAEIAKLNESEFMAVAVDESGYSQNELKAAFNSVANKKNWKLPIDTQVPETANKDLIARAITWYTGSETEFGYSIGGYWVRAAGYYNTIGA